MQWRAAGMGTLVLVTSLGCPHEYGREGTVDRAVHKDVKERQRQRCSEEELELFCEDGESPQCREKCG
jgi:hypothetical protein